MADIILGTTQVRTLRHDAHKAFHNATHTLPAICMVLKGEQGLTKDQQLDALTTVRDDIQKFINDPSEFLTALGAVIEPLNTAIEIVTDRDLEAHKAMKDSSSEDEGN